MFVMFSNQALYPEVETLWLWSPLPTHWKSVHWSYRVPCHVWTLPCLPEKKKDGAESKPQQGGPQLCIHPQSLSARPWRWMVGRRFSFLEASFSVAVLNLGVYLSWDESCPLSQVAHVSRSIAWESPEPVTICCPAQTIPLHVTTCWVSLKKLFVKKEQESSIWKPGFFLSPFQQNSGPVVSKKIWHSNMFFVFSNSFAVGSWMFCFFVRGMRVEQRVWAILFRDQNCGAFFTHRKSVLQEWRINVSALGIESVIAWSN